MEDDVNFMVRIRVVLREIELLNLSYETMNIPKNYILDNNCIVIEQNELENLDIMFNCILDTFLKIGFQYFCWSILNCIGGNYRFSPIFFKRRLRQFLRNF